MDHLTLFRNGVPFEVSVQKRINSKAKHIGLRLHLSESKIILTLPSVRKEKEGLKFIESKKVWIQKHFLIQAPSPIISLEPETRVSILGESFILKSTAQRGVFKDGEILFVSGDLSHFPSRVKRYVKKVLQDYCEKKAKFYASQISKSFQKVTIRVLSSRFGSCSSHSNLSFALGLSFMPLEVIDYVIAHEVAHLQEMNHSENFWHLTEMLY
ncbi:MAG: DUF45 domain-containing protein, partial [Alphaproteobacteria bacterium]|nr:DUF45 domain-containing protein [Alphaproteobacteria bacterium]